LLRVTVRVILGRVKAADSSVVVAAFASWHEHHRQARKALDGGIHMIDHCALETYSVLTRLPLRTVVPRLIGASSALAGEQQRSWLSLAGIRGRGGAGDGNRTHGEGSSEP
jgi:hypothetical protein